MREFSNGRNNKSNQEIFNDEELIPFSKIEMDEFLNKKYQNYSKLKTTNRIVIIDDQILQDLDELSLDTD